MSSYHNNYTEYRVFTQINIDECFICCNETKKYMQCIGCKKKMCCLCFIKCEAKTCPYCKRNIDDDTSWVTEKNCNFVTEKTISLTKKSWNKLPIKLINKCLIMRPTHPVAYLIDDGIFHMVDFIDGCKYDNSPNQPIYGQTGIELVNTFINVGEPKILCQLAIRKIAIQKYGTDENWKDTIIYKK
jgi:hypothetical protein